MRLAESEPKLGQVSHLVHLTTGRFEQNCCTNTAVNVSQRPFRVRVKGSGVGQRPGDIGIDGDIRSRLAQLAEDHGAEF